MANCPPHMVPGGARPASPRGARTFVQSVRRARGGSGRPPSSGSLEAMRSVTDGRGIGGCRGEWEAGVVAPASSRRRLRVERGRRLAGRPPPGVDVAPPPEVL
jgi:hypothetical protein